MKSKKISKTTTNRGEFNRAYKEYLERKGRIHCSRCRYHKGENYTGNVYGGYEEANGHPRFHHPNWKLVSKHPKQWMEKPIKITKKIVRGWSWERTYVQIKF